MSASVASFFRLLPLDVQHSVIQHWLCGKVEELTEGEADLLAHLSALDIACCHHASRSHFLTLIGRITFTAASCFKFLDSRAVRNLLNFMRWIHSRQIAVKTLCPTTENIPDLEEFASDFAALPFSLPSVTCLQLDMDIGHSALWLITLLEVCPNLTHMESSLCDNEPKDFIWTALKGCHRPHLKKLIVPTNSPIQGCAQAMLTVLSEFGPQLEELNIVGNYFVNVVIEALVAQQCPHLRALTLIATEISTTSAELLFGACSQLTQLTMLEADVGPISIMLEAGRQQLKVVRVRCIPWTFFLKDFAAILERHPLLDELTVDGYQYHRSGKLSLYGKARLTLVDLERIFRACTVRELHSHHLDIDTTRLSWMGDSLQHLQSLQVCSYVFELLAPCLPCSQLKQLTLHEPLSRSTVAEITAHCPHLQCLRILPAFGRASYMLSQSDLKALLTACPLLTELALGNAPDMDCKSLVQTLVLTKARLEIIRWCGSELGKEDVSGFRSLAQERELIPVPVLVLDPFW